MSEERRRQLAALLDEEWGPYVPGSKYAGTKLEQQALQQEQALCRLKALARRQWPESYNARPKLRLIQGGKERTS